MRIFLGANVLFSAARSDGAVRQLLNLRFAARHELWADGYVAKEARCNLASKALAGLIDFAALLVRLHLEPAQGLVESIPAAMPLPEKDRPVLVAAMRLGCEALVTGDRAHFGRFYGRTLGGVMIHSPRSLAEALLL